MDFLLLYEKATDSTRRLYFAKETGEDSRRPRNSDRDVHCSAHTCHGSAGMPLVCMPMPLEALELEKHHVNVNALAEGYCSDVKHIVSCLTF